MLQDLNKVIPILHDSYIEKIEKTEFGLRFTLASGSLAEQLEKDFYLFYIDFLHIKLIEFEDWSENKTKFSKIETVIRIATSLWITQCELNENDVVIIHGHGGNSPDETSIGGTISIVCKQYKIKNKSEIKIIKKQFNTL